MILLYLFILIVSFHSTSQHLWLSYSVLFHCIIYSFHSPILLLLIMPSSMIVSYYLPLSHHISHVCPYSTRYPPDHNRLDLLIRSDYKQISPFFFKNRNIRPSSPLLSLDPSTFRSKIVSVLTTPPLPSLPLSSHDKTSDV